MSGTISFGGLSSGLDTQAIITQLTNLRQKQLLSSPNKALADAKSKKLALSTLSTSLNTLRTTALTLKDPTNAAYNIRKATSSADTTVSIGTVDSSKAVNGTYNITNITQLAQPDRVLFSGVADTDVTQYGTGTLAITYQGGTTNITIDSTNNTLDGIKTAINDADAGVTASIVNDGNATTPYRLVLTSNDSGADTRITQNLASITTLTVDAAASAATANEPFDAAYKLNGVDFSSASNTVTDAINGVTFNLLATETTDTIHITVQSDTASVVAKVSAFVTAYNTARSTIRSLLAYDTETKSYGPLGKDINLQNMDNDLHRIMFNSYSGFAGHDYKSLAQIGVTADDDGTLKVDSGKLTTALQANASDVRLLFQGDTIDEGIAKKVYNYMDTATKVNGTLYQRQKILDDQIINLNKLIVDRQTQLDSYKAKLEAKFNNLELVMNKLKAQQSAVDNFAAQYASKNNQLY